MQSAAPVSVAAVAGIAAGATAIWRLVEGSALPSFTAGVPALPAVIAGIVAATAAAAALRWGTRPPRVETAEGLPTNPTPQPNAATLDVVRLSEELSRTKADQEEFAYVVSHDLQEPVRLTAGFVQLLARQCEGKLDAQAEDFMASARESAAEMQRRIQHLVDYSRIGTRGGEFRPCSCQALLEQAMAALRGPLDASSAVLTHDPLPTVSGDASQLAQVFRHLISNAIKFCQEKPPRIHISIRQAASGWNFSVRDNGIGIDAGETERIFGIFQRLHTQSEYPGAGVGLALSKKIVERHGGRIWAESEPGAGSTFHFTIPNESKPAAIARRAAATGGL